MVLFFRKTVLSIHAFAILICLGTIVFVALNQEHQFIFNKVIEESYVSIYLVMVGCIGFLTLFWIGLQRQKKWYLAIQFVSLAIYPVVFVAGIELLEFTAQFPSEDLKNMFYSLLGFVFPLGSCMFFLIHKDIFY